MRPRIVHLTTTHRATDPRIFQKECRSLARAGYEVVYVVPHDRDEVVDGVQIRAVPPPASGKERLIRTTQAVYRRALDEGPDAVYHLHDAELLGIGLVLKARGRTVVYDAHEDTPKQVRYQHWIPAWLRPAVALGFWAVERLAGRVFDGIITAEPLNARRCEELGVPLLTVSASGGARMERSDAPVEVWKRFPLGCSQFGQADSFISRAQKGPRTRWARRSFPP